MNTIKAASQYVLAGLAAGAAWTCMGCMAVFAGILGLQARSPWLWPLTLLLLPVALLFAAVGLVIYPVNMVAAVALWRRKGKYGAATDAGLEVRTTLQGAERVLPWQQLREVVAVFSPPVTSYEAVVVSGETVEIDFLEPLGGVRSALEARGIPMRRERGPRQEWTR